MTEEYITQISEEIGGRETKKLSKEFSRTGSRVLDALGEFLLNLQVRKCSATVPGTFPNSYLENREPNRDCSQNDSFPKVELSTCRTKLSWLRTSWIENKKCNKKSTFAQLGFLQENKWRRARQVSHKSAVKIPLRQMRQTSFCWLFNNWRATLVQPIRVTRSTEIQNCPNPSRQQCRPSIGNQKSLKCLKICSKQVWIMTTISQKKDIIVHSHSVMRGVALQMFKNITSSIREICEKIRENVNIGYGETQSSAISNQSSEPEVNWILGWFPWTSKKRNRRRRSSNHWSIFCAKMPPHLIKLIMQAYMENSTYGQIVSHLIERELEVNGWEAANELEIKNVTQQVKKPDLEKPKPTRQKARPFPKSVPSTQTRIRPKPKQHKECWKQKNSCQTLTPTLGMPTKSTPTMQTTEMTENHELSIHHVRHVAKRTTPQKKGFMKPMLLTGNFTGKVNRKHILEIQFKKFGTVQFMKTLASLRALLRIANTSDMPVVAVYPRSLRA